jgi:hypothetical protein
MNRMELGREKGIELMPPMILIQYPWCVCRLFLNFRTLSSSLLSDIFAHLSKPSDPLIDAVCECLANLAELEVVPHCAASLARSVRRRARRDLVERRFGPAHVYVGVRG